LLLVTGYWSLLFRLLPIACCLLPIAYCLLVPSAVEGLPIACWSFVTSCWLLVAGRYLKNSKFVNDEQLSQENCFIREAILNFNFMMRSN